MLIKKQKHKSLRMTYMYSLKYYKIHNQLLVSKIRIIEKFRYLKNLSNLKLFFSVENCFEVKYKRIHLKSNV